MKALKTILALCLVAGCGAGLWLHSCIKSTFDVARDTSLYVYPQYRVENIRQALVGMGASGVGFDIIAWQTDYKPSTGHYVVSPGETLLGVMRRLKRHEQTPVRLVVPSVRLVSQLPSRLAPHLMMDSVQIAEVLTDEELLATWGFDALTLPAMIVPNTYEVYWDINPKTLMERLKKEYDRFWNGSRSEKAEAMGLSRVQVSTLASIVAEETANNAEKPTVAGLYYNRVKRGMKLEADPTVKFALGDFTLRRILFRHLECESPYNTYRVVGLPPGPIRIPDIVDIDAVLNYQHHDYIYMCAKEDFSGTHNFARNLAEHSANARRYQAALSRRGIK